MTRRAIDHPGVWDPSCPRCRAAYDLQRAMDPDPLTVPDEPYEPGHVTPVGGWLLIVLLVVVVAAIACLRFVR